MLKIASRANRKWNFRIELFYCSRNYIHTYIQYFIVLEKTYKND